MQRCSCSIVARSLPDRCLMAALTRRSLRVHLSREAALTVLNARSIVCCEAAVWRASSLSREGDTFMPTHPIVHVEIPARDLEAAGQFYARVFDWQLDLSMPEYPQF